tara:strand:+ start:3752 stop:4759 length:1008 start_codon:yes stop_codon:yes gene_type:complete
MLKGFFWNKSTFFYAWLMLAWLLALSWYNVQILVTYNEWNREWYDAIQALNKERFWFLFWDFNPGRMWNFIWRKDNIMPSFLEILVIYVPLATYSIWQTQRYVFAWREANTHHYLKRWERSTQTIEGASQRLQEDLMRFGTTLQSLFTGLFSAVLILFAFVPVLWTLSEGLPIWNGQIIPGFLVWAVLAISLGGTLVSFIFGYPLPGLEYKNQVVEAEFRKKLVWSEDDVNHRLTSDLFPMFSAIKRNYYRLFNYYMGFGLWQTAFGLLVGNMAIILLADSYFAQLITFGVLIQVTQAFGRVEGSLTFFIDRWTTIVEFQSVVRRLREFNKILSD